MKGGLQGEFGPRRQEDGETPLTVLPVSAITARSGHSRPECPGGQREPVAERARAFELHAAQTPAGGIRQEVMQDALRLLATWAVRAARARTPGSDST